MALPVTDEHRQLAEAVRGWAERHCPPGVVRAATNDGGGIYPDKLRPSLAGQGLLGLHLPEAAGGQGFGIPELAVVTEELARALTPGAFLPTVLASTVLAAHMNALPGTQPAGELAALLAGLAAGTLSGAVALAPGIAAVPAGAGGPLVIDGSCGPVLGVPGADLVLLPVAAGPGEVWVAVDASWLDITPLEGLDLTRPAGRVSAHRLTVPAGRTLTSLPAGVPESVSAALFAAEACGIADWAVTTASEYAKVRHQFGRPIGQFQAVKHRCAQMLTAAEQAAAAAWDAARAQRDDESAGRDFAAAVAAVVAVDAAVSCAHECIQVLGGIGYTWEHDAHLYYRRALSLRALLGPSTQWATKAARLALAGARRAVDVDLPPEALQVREQVRAELAEITGAESGRRAGLLGDGGWVAPHLPRPWGRGAGPLEQVVIGQELRAAGLRPPGLGIGAWVVPALVQYGTPEQQQRFLPATLRGEIVWCQLFSEPGAGSDLAGLVTRAERANGGWRLTGQKVWTSLAKQAAWAICLARTDPAAPRHDGISYFLVDMSSPGVDVRPLREMTGDAFFNEVFLDQVFVPDDLVVGEVGKGWRVARMTLANERVSLSQSWTFGCGVPDLIAVLAGLDGGAGANGLDGAAGGVVLARAGQLICEGHAIDLLGLRTTLKQLSGTEPGATGSVRKLLGMRVAQQIAAECWSLTGADGAAGDGRWSRSILFTRALTIGGGTTDIQLNIIGERILGLPRDPEPER